MKRILSLFRWSRAALLLAFLCIPIGFTAAEEYPNRTIKVLVGFPPGGGTDTAARVLGAALAQELGQTVIIENKPGAAGRIAAAEVARVTPDGYTLLVTIGGHSIFGAIVQDLPFDTVKGFDWISNIVTLPFYITVPADYEFKTLADLIAKAKAAPGTVSFGSTGPGSTHHLAPELLAIRTGTNFLHVPYRGEAPLLMAVMTGEVKFGLSTPTLLVQNVQGGKLRALATTAAKRTSDLPDVPTVQEALGIKDYDVSTWFALVGPAGMPPTVLAKLNGAVNKALARPEVRARLAAVGQVDPTTSQAMHDRVERELAMWTETVTKAEIPKQ